MMMIITDLVDNASIKPLVNILAPNIPPCYFLFSWRTGFQSSLESQADTGQKRTENLTCHFYFASKSVLYSFIIFSNNKVKTKLILVGSTRGLLRRWNWKSKYLVLFPMPHLYMKAGRLLLQKFFCCFIFWPSRVHSTAAGRWRLHCILKNRSGKGRQLYCLRILLSSSQVGYARKNRQLRDLALPVLIKSLFKLRSYNDLDLSIFPQRIVIKWKPTAAVV